VVASVLEEVLFSGKTSCPSLRVRPDLDRCRPSSGRSCFNGLTYTPGSAGSAAAHVPGSISGRRRRDHDLSPRGFPIQSAIAVGMGARRSPCFGFRSPWSCSRPRSLRARGVVSSGRPRFAPRALLFDQGSPEGVSGRPSRRCRPLPRRSARHSRPERPRSRRCPGSGTSAWRSQRSSPRRARSRTRDRRCCLSR
jgi:hypothetical protein